MVEWQIHTSEAAGWACHVNIAQNLKGTFPARCWIYSTKWLKSHEVTSVCINIIYVILLAMKVYPCISIDLKLFTYFHMCKKECALTWKHHHSLNIYACFYAVIHECAKVLREEDDMKTEKYELNKVEKYELDWERRGEDDKSKEERWVEETKRTRQEMSHTGFCLCQTMCEQCVCVREG